MYIFALNYVRQYSLFAEHSWVIYWAHKTYQIAWKPKIKQ